MKIDRKQYNGKKLLYSCERNDIYEKDTQLHCSAFSWKP